MSTSLLEQLRSAHEDIESNERMIVSILQEKPRNHRDRVIHGHKVSILLDRVVSTSKHSKELYKDEQGTFKEECSAMRGHGTFTSFYEHIKRIRSFHRKYPNMELTKHEPSMEEIMNPKVEFSGEERFGRYVDLHQFHTRFLNIPAFKRQMEMIKSSSAAGKHESRRKKTSSGTASRSHVDYLKYLTCFHDFAMIEQSQKEQSLDFQQYLEDLKQYLLDFYRRTQPLVDLDDVIAETRAKFERQWSLNQVTSWKPASTRSNQPKDSENASFCTYCNKQFATKGVYDNHLNGKKHKRALERTSDHQKIDGEHTESKSVIKLGPKISREIAFDEVLIRRMQELLTEVVHATIAYLEMKQTRTAEELQAEIAEDEDGGYSDIDIGNEDGNDDDGDETTPFYNPLNLPLGWDGKPIPYWLYKLHGLGVEFKCEICGNHSYWGRRAFDRHFQEWRHAFGMRCLKIPNTKHFHDITKMQDAMQLYEKLKGQIGAETWDASIEEEFEDAEGNVLNRKTYEDLTRQGLL